MEEYRVEDKVIRAGYSSRTRMVYLSLVRSQLYGWSPEEIIISEGRG